MTTGIETQNKNQRIDEIIEEVQKTLQSLLYYILPTLAKTTTVPVKVEVVQEETETEIEIKNRIKHTVSNLSLSEEEAGKLKRQLVQVYQGHTESGRSINYAFNEVVEACDKFLKNKGRVEDSIKDFMGDIPPYLNNKIFNKEGIKINGQTYSTVGDIFSGLVDSKPTDNDSKPSDQHMILREIANKIAKIARDNLSPKKQLADIRLYMYNIKHRYTDVDKNYKTYASWIFQLTGISADKIKLDLAKGSLDLYKMYLDALSVTLFIFNKYNNFSTIAKDRFKIKNTLYPNYKYTTGINFTENKNIPPVKRYYTPITCVVPNGEDFDDFLIQPTGADRYVIKNNAKIKLNIPGIEIFYKNGRMDIINNRPDKVVLFSQTGRTSTQKLDA